MLTTQRSHAGVALALCGLFLPGVLPAQDLAAIAKKEKDRRSKVTKPVKVLTEKDGEEAATKGAGSVTALQSEGTTSSEDAAKLERQSGAAAAEGQDAWKARADGARATIADSEKTLAKLEKDLSTYRSDMTPTSAEDLQDPMREQKRSARLYEMTKQIEAQKGAVAAARKALTALEDEARSKGVPPGWIR